MNEQQQKNKRTIKIIFSMAIIPFGIAWFLSSNSLWMGGGTNKGDLISPPVTTEKTEFIGFDDFSKQNIKELQGHWILINVIPHVNCNAVCQNALHKTKQLRLMMNKDLTRIRRLAIVIPTVNAESAAQWWKDDTRLLRIKPTSSLIKKLKQVTNDNIPEGLLLLMDPLGNLMMRYEPGFDPYDVTKDLKKLLKISQIG